MYIPSIDYLKQNEFYLYNTSIQNSQRDILIYDKNIKIENNYYSKVSQIMKIMKKYFNKKYYKYVFRIKNNLAKECQKTEDIIKELYPSNFAMQLISGSSINAVDYNKIVILCSDIVNFTALTNNCTPMEIITMLKHIFESFDVLCSKYKLTKVKFSNFYILKD